MHTGRAGTPGRAPAAKNRGPPRTGPGRGGCATPCRRKTPPARRTSPARVRAGPLPGGFPATPGDGRSPSPSGSAPASSRRLRSLLPLPLQALHDRGEQPHLPGAVALRQFFEKAPVHFLQAALLDPPRFTQVGRHLPTRTDRAPPVGDQYVGQRLLCLL